MDKRTLIQSIAKQNRSDPDSRHILWSRHASVELINEGWTRHLIEDALVSCEVIEDYPTQHRPLPDCLVLGWLAETQPMHAVIAIDLLHNRLFVVTVYQPSPQEWKNDWRSRK
ncbi:MAG: DUF4258 domain-containing protein [Chloroflexota bacterium]